MKTKKQIAGYQSLGEEEGIGNECLIGIELILGVIKSSRIGLW